MNTPVKFLAIAGLLLGGFSAQADITTGLVGYWPLSDGPGSSTVADGSGYGNTGTLTNFTDATYNNMWTATTDPTNMDAYALNFNPGGHAGSAGFGTNTYVNIPDSTSLDLPSAKNQWTLSAWVYPTVTPASEPTNAGIICKGSPNNQAAYALYMSEGNFVTILRNASGGGGTTASSTNTLAANTWYNVTAVIQEPKPSKASEIIVYLNGINNSATNGNTYTTDWTTNAPVTIGCCSAANGKITNAFAGYIDQVRIYDRALSSTDVFQLYTNDANEMPPVITQQPVSATVDQGSAFTNSVSIFSASQSYYQWFTNGVPLAGATNSQIIINPALPLWNSISYDVVVTNDFGAVTSSVVQLTVLPTVPEIVNQLPNTYSNLLGTNLFVLYPGASPAFSVTALSATPVTYFWFTNGVPVGGVNVSNFTWPQVQQGSISDYCIVSNASGMATTMVWAASVIADPLNSTGGLAPYPQAVMALNPIGYWRMNDTNLDGPDQYTLSGGNSAGDNGWVCHDYAGGNDGVYTNVYLGNVNGGTGYNPFTDPSDNSAQFGFDADDESGDNGDQDANSIEGINFGSPAGMSQAFTVEAWVSGYDDELASAGIVALGYGGGGEQFALDCGAANNAFRFFMRDAAGNTHLVNSSVLASTTAGEGPWYHLVGVVDEINNQAVSFYINGQLVGTATVTNGSGVLAPTEPMSIGARMSSETTNFNYQFTGFINDVAVFNYALSSNQVANEYANAGTEPPFFILPPPTNVTLIAGATLTIPVTVWGTGPLTNQWYDVNGNPIAGTLVTTNGNAVNATLTYSNVPGAWNGQEIKLVAGNAYGSTNFAVSLTVLTAPVLTNTIPSQITLLQGQLYTYVSGAIGAQPIGYQWYGNGTGLANQTNTTYSLTASNSGTFTYYLIATNSLGAATSVVSTLTVLPPPTSPYATNVLSLNPVGYWPMHEMEAPVQGDIETNYGSLGLLGTGYYADWVGLQGIIHGFRGALANDPDTAVYFNYTGGGNTGATTNCLIIPVNSTNAVLNPPFSVECWFWPTNKNQDDIWAQAGYEGLNAGNEGGGGGSVCGLRLYWGGNFSIYSYDNSSTLNATESGSYSAGQWYHIVLTCDASTNMIVYVDGQVAIASTNFTGMYSPDYWDPITLMTGRGYTRTLPGGIDEFAVYTTNLQASDIQQHYNDASGPAGAYVADVTNDNPVIYLRMDSSAYTPPPVGAWPVLVNYASGGVNGVYTPGTMPGVALGPIHANGLPINGLTGTNVAPLSGVSSYADAGYAAAYNPVGSNAFTMTAMFRGNPCDGRVQDIVSHSDLSWRIVMNSNGHLQCLLGEDPSNVVNSAKVYNDGNWHEVADVYQPASKASVTGTNLLYVDGILDTNVTGTSTNGIYPGTNVDVMIGAAPDYTNNPAAIGRQFNGQVCEVALFNAALTPVQLQTLYAAAGGVPAQIEQQPVSASINTQSSFTNTVTAIGSGLLSYQWYTNGMAIGGATNASLIFNPVLPGNASTDYYVIVTNLYGAATSAVVSLTVYNVPAFTSQLPQPYTNLFALYPGASPVLSVTAAGPQPISYQWFTNGVLDGADTTNSLPLTNVQVSFTNDYCVAGNSYGYSTSIVWSAQVVANPPGQGGIGLAPYPQQVLSLSPIGYWRMNDTNLDGLDNGNGDNGYVCHDYAGGNDGVYSNVYLGNVNSGTGYNPVTDPSDNSVQLGYDADSGSDPGDQDANSIEGINFGSPAGTSGAFTVEAWVSGTDEEIAGAGIVSLGYGNGGEQFDLDCGGTHSAFRFFMRDAAGNTHGVSSTNVANTTASPAFGPWYHLVGVVDGINNTNVTFYINGSPAGSTILTNGAGILASSYPMVIGARSSAINTNDNFQFVGLIDDVAVFNYALSPLQVENEYVAGGGTNAPYFNPAPPANGGAAANATLTIPVTALGTPPMGFWWTNVTTGAGIASGLTGNANGNVTLGYVHVPLSWNANQLELTVTNAYGTTNAFFTLAITNGVNTNPTNIASAVTNNTLYLSWPADHTGWQLQAQTNRVGTGLSTNWANYNPSTGSNQVVIPINLTNGTVFYRLTY